MSKTLFSLLAFSFVISCSRPANKAAAVQPYCKPGQDPKVDQCRPDSPDPSRQKPEVETFCPAKGRKMTPTECSQYEADARTEREEAAKAKRCLEGDASECTPNSSEFNAACARNQSQPVCSTSTTTDLCTQRGTATVRGQTGCLSLLAGPCSSFNQIMGATDNSYCAPQGYTCQQVSTSVACAQDPNSLPRTPNPTESGSVTPGSTERPEKDHGDKFLLVSVGKDRRNVYGLFLSAEDPDVSNIKVKYVRNLKFDGKKGPEIKAEISWEVRGKKCSGKEQIFSLETYVKPKPLTAVCEGTSR